MLDDTKKDLLEILENFEGRDRERFVGRCEDLAERMIAKQKLVGDTTGDQRPAQARDA